MNRSTLFTRARNGVVLFTLGTGAALAQGGPSFNTATAEGYITAGIAAIGAIGVLMLAARVVKRVWRMIG